AAQAGEFDLDRGAGTGIDSPPPLRKVLILENAAGAALQPRVVSARHGDVAVARRPRSPPEARSQAAMYRQLDCARILDTAERLERRIAERFPASGLRRVAAELTEVVRERDALLRRLD